MELISYNIILDSEYLGIITLYKTFSKNIKHLSFIRFWELYFVYEQLFQAVFL